MTKDEMKNRISMALKDPILQQGFEIICKNLADLEGCLLAEQELTQTLEKEKCELLGIIQEKDKAIKKLIADMADLEWQLQEVAKDNDYYQAENKRLEEQFEKMKNCWNCKNWNWKHGKCQKKLKGECFKASKWESKE